MPQKGLVDLLYVWKEICNIGVSAELEIWGEGELEAELLRLSEALNIRDSMIFRGYVGEVSSKLATMDVFVLPSYAEGNSNAILEAMVAGLPVVSTRVGGTAMMIGDKGGELLFDAGDRESLKRNLLLLINSQEKRKEMGEEMRNRIKYHFDIELVSTTYAKTYDLLLSGKREYVNAVSNSII